MSLATQSASQQYVDGDYAAKHTDWHLSDAPNKAANLQAGLVAMMGDSSQKKWRIADIGAGAGGVLDEMLKRMRALQPDVDVAGTGFEISAQAIEIAREKFPRLEMRQKFFEASDGPFDAVMFVDVLEHVENPWELLRTARSASKYMFVHQPLLENFSTFRHNDYRGQRETWGHISFYTYRFFLDMAATTGWEPLHLDLLAPWEMAGATTRGGLPQNLLLKMNRVMASFFISGFYLNGVFRARD